MCKLTNKLIGPNRKYLSLCAILVGQNIILIQLLILLNRRVCSRKWRSFGRTGPVAINYHESPLGTGNHVKHWGTTTFPFTLANVFSPDWFLLEQKESKCHTYWKNWVNRDSASYVLVILFDFWAQKPRLHNKISDLYVVCVLVDFFCMKSHCMS